MTVTAVNRLVHRSTIYRPITQKQPKHRGRYSAKDSSITA